MASPKPPLWTSLWLRIIADQFDAMAKTTLSGLAIISSATAVIGFASQFDNPDLGVYLRCCALGFALWLIARTFWAGAWVLPALETRRPLLIYALVAVVGFTTYATVSIMGSLGATGGGISQNLTQQDNIDKLDNSGQDFAFYIGEMTVVRTGLVEQAEEARRSEAAEIAGQGPTGEADQGPVSNSYAAAAGKYDQAAQLLTDALVKAEGHIDGLNAVIAEMRPAQIDTELSAADKAVHLKVLSRQAIAEMRALLALDPARFIRTVAENIATGVPVQSRAKVSSQARIAEISAGMRAYAARMKVEADRIATLAPQIPQQITLSSAERLLETMWRMPGLTMAALLLDLCGWIAVGFRVAIYQALKAKIEAENALSAPSFVTLEDFNRVAHYIELVQQSVKRLEHTDTPDDGDEPDA